MKEADEVRMTNIVLEIERWSIYDGPGARTVVFFKGCPLRCQWCANPESHAREPQIAIFAQKCIGCGNCTSVCPNATALPPSQGGFKDREFCDGCGKCVEACPASAREWMGKQIGIGEVMDTILKDMVFYRSSGGGVTFSGGEPLAQPVFFRQLVGMCNSLGINTAVETCGYFPWETSKDILKMVDLVFMDIKHIDAEVHKNITGKSNELILQNGIKMSEEGIPLIIRVPVVPGTNDSPENIKETAKFVRQNLLSARGIELLPYHSLGASKYVALGLKYELAEIEPPSDEEMSLLRSIIRETGVPCIIS
jgi:pyruvate formate lyase activating enzyme